MVLSPPNLPIRGAGSRITGATYEWDITDAINFLANPPVATLLQTVSTQTLTTATWTTITWDNPATSGFVDTYSGYVPASSTSRYTAQVNGTYYVRGLVNFTNNGTGLRAAKLLKNGSVVQGSSDRRAAPSVTGASPTAEFYVPMVIGDYIELQGYQSSGGNLNTSFDSDSCSVLNIQWMHF